MILKHSCILSSIYIVATYLGKMTSWEILFRKVEELFSRRRLHQPKLFAKAYPHPFILLCSTFNCSTLTRSHSMTTSTHSLRNTWAPRLLIPFNLLPKNLHSAASPCHLATECESLLFVPTFNSQGWQWKYAVYVHYPNRGEYLKSHEAIIELATMTFKFSSCNLYYVAYVVTVVLHRHVTCYAICQESFFLNLNLYSTVCAM